MSATPQFIGVPISPVASIVNADGTTFKTIIAAASGGQRIDSLSIANTDAANAYVVQLAVQVSGVDYELGEVTVPIGAGTNGTAKSVAALNPTDIPALQYSENYALYLGAGAALRARAKTAVAGGNGLKFIGIGGTY